VTTPVIPAHAGTKGWTPDAFQTDFTRRDDGALLLTPRATLAPLPHRMLDALGQWATVAPDRLCVARRNGDGEWVSLTYAQVFARVQRIAAALIARNLSADRPIAILSGNSIEHLLLAFAAMWAGIPYCPVSASYSQVATDLKKLRFVFELLTPGLVAAFGTVEFVRALELAPIDAELVGDLDRVGSRPQSMRTMTRFEALDADPSDKLAAAHARTGGNSVARFLLTSGSTGQPKAVIVTEQMIVSNAAMVQQAMPFLATEPPVLVDWLPWNHTFGGSHNLGLLITNGGTLYIDDGKPTPAGFAATLRTLREVSPTVYFNVPKGFDVLAHHLRADATLRRTFYRRLHAYFFAGAALSQHTWDALDEIAMQERGHKVPMLSGLGATETGPSVTFTTPEQGRAGVIGLPAAGNFVKLQQVGSKLEIRVKGPNVTPGYWRRPALTQAAFDAEGFYRLGDAVKLTDPSDPTQGLRFDGRIAEDFKLASGTWVSVGPLRASLIAALSPLAQDVVITGLNEDYLGALIIPDLRACADALGWANTPTFAALAAAPALRAQIRERLQRHVAANPASSTRIARAMLLDSPPSLDAGEITDKGSINQRAVLDCREALVRDLHAAPGIGTPTDKVIVVS
jgi:feruloyl-CoA synthase